MWDDSIARARVVGEYFRPVLLGFCGFSTGERVYSQDGGCAKAAPLILSGSRKEMACLHGSEKHGNLSE